MRKTLLTLSAFALGFGLPMTSVQAESYGGSYGGSYGEQHAKSEISKSIVETAIANEQFSTLVTALQAAGLVEALQGEGPFTVFAPTNAAFDALPEGELEALLAEENRPILTSILTYHVVPGKIMAGDITAGTTEVESLQGSSLTVEKSPNGVSVNGANVTTADIKTSNGVIHVIDAVVLPQQ